MRRVARLRQHHDAVERDGDSDVSLSQLVARREHLLSVAAQLLAHADEALLRLRLRG